MENFRRAAELDPPNVNRQDMLSSKLPGGRRWAEAIAAHRRTIALSPDSLNLAITELGRLLQFPSIFNYQSSVHTLRVDPAFAPLRGNPRFEALLKDPKNNAPLF